LRIPHLRGGDSFSIPTLGDYHENHFFIGLFLASRRACGLPLAPSLDTVSLWLFVGTLPDNLVGLTSRILSNRITWAALRLVSTTLLSDLKRLGFTSN
jgi:hypothetical protein